uniref:Reverse transcriptase domain-containing protein n=1 Tax=Tanacetum cinerariifolium TaxID=118510 RepID=A0A6L2LKL9_TANCI|nr:reverse transcriptase domain-containing protein [Tanacetum cinerariifolium]
MKGAPECMRISGFMHRVNNPELTKRLNEHVPKTMKEMMITTTAFIRGEAAATSKKKGHVSWKAHDQSKRHTSDKRTPKEILATEASKFQPPPPMVTPVEKKSSNKFCDFNNDKGHSTDECMQLKKQIEELKETAVKDKPTTIYMVRSWQRTVKQKVTQSFEWVKEIAFPPLAASNGTEGPLVIEAEMGRHMIHRMYMDDGSSMEILYEHCFNRLQPEIKSQMVPATTSLTGFSGETIWPLGQLRLLVIIGDATHSTKAWMNFMIVKLLSPYNGIIGRPSTILIPTECASVITSSVIPREERTRPANFKKNLDIFAWQPSDMTGVPRSVAEHRLNIREGYSPVRQKKKGQAPERAKAIQAEVQKLVEAGITREVYYHDWLSNPVMVKKHDGSWRMCVDLTDLNKACPQDCYPLPEIDCKVESLCGYPFKCFLDGYKGYHQIQLAEADEEKTDFHTGQRVYCYTKMPFDLKNAGATYQRLIDQAFKGQIGRNIEVYVDDFVVKIYTEAEMMRDIEETFRTLRKVNMKLNPKKCSFGLAEGVFLGPRTSVKGQILADFLIEMTGDVSQAVPTAETKKEPWMLFIDGSSCMDGSGTYVAKEDNMIKYLEIVKGLVSGFTTFSISQVPRSKNKKADVLSKIASTSFAHLSKQVLVEVLENISIKEKEVAVVIKEDGPTWMTRLVDYLKGGVLPGDKKAPPQGSSIRVNGGVLYRRSFLTPWLRCVGPLQAEYALFSEGPGKVKFLIVSMDYFTKWIEAKAMATITGGHVKKFVWDYIVCRFGIPGKIISDNGKQLSDNPFKDLCDKLNITQRFASVKYPQSNGLVERTNRSLGEGIKSRLGEGNKKWVEELPHVLWAHRTMIKSSHAVDVVNNDEELCLNLDLLEERRERAVICEAKAKSKMMKYYKARVRGITFKPCDFVYRSNDASHAVAGGKLGLKWKGPYEVTEALGNGAYKLRAIDGRVLQKTWNIENLKRCYL